MIRFIITCLLYLFATGCSGGADDSSAPAGEAGAPSKPAMVEACPTTQEGMPAFCDNPLDAGLSCMFHESGRLMLCRCAPLDCAEVS
jgi:hypothetical protein